MQIQPPVVQHVFTMWGGSHISHPTLLSCGTHMVCTCFVYTVCSPTRTTIEPLTASFMKNHDDIDFGADVKLRRNGSNRLPLAVPNPYSTSESIRTRFQDL